jgi:ubiquinone biosynthesis protein
MSLALTLDGSSWIDAVPGLREDAAAWRAQAPAWRREAEAQALAAATPRLWPDTIAALASTAWRVVATAAPDAPLALLTAAGSAAGLPIAPPSSGAGTIARAERLVRAGGPAYIKLGQFIASADGLLPDGWVRAFAWCRDDAPPLEPGVAQDVVERELGPGAVLMEDEPLAAGSIGQVHRGTLPDGTAVVVKVRRPGLRGRIRADIETMALLAAGAEKVQAAAQAANLTGFVDLFSRLTFAELDFRLEASNLVESALGFEHAGADYVRVPHPVPGLVTERVLVMEHVPGVPYSELAATGRPFDGDRLLHLGIRGVLEATLVYGLFHGDLHAGNVLVNADGTFSLVDFGICGRLDGRQREGLIAYLVGFAASDAQAQVDAMKRFGAVPAGADDTELVAQLQAELDLLEARDRGAVTFDHLGETLGRLLRVLAANGFRMPPDLVLFFKNLLYLGSFAAGVAPHADVLAEVQTVLGDLWADGVTTSGP